MVDLKRSALTFLFLSSIALWSTPAFAQMDLAGEWAPQFHEDQPERLAALIATFIAETPVHA